MGWDGGTFAFLPETPVEAAEESICRVKTENTLLGYRIDGLIGCDFCANLEAKEPQAVLQARPCLLERCKCAKKWNSSRGDLSKHVQKNTYRVSLVFTLFLAVVCHFIPHLVHAKTMQKLCNSTVGVSQSLSLASV